MKVILSRFYGTNCTKGTICLFEGDDLLWTCKSLELRYLNNEKDISCIPEGTYNVIKYTSGTKGRCFRILNVPERSDILIHKGNFVSGKKIDSKGCILVGRHFTDINADGFIDIAESTLTLDRLLALLPMAFKLYII